MTREVLISIAGLQFEVDDNDVIEVISKGQYFIKNQKHYIMYQEYDENYPNQVSHNTLKLSPHQIDISKRGIGNVHMIFEEGKETMSTYTTPYGSLYIGISTSKIELTESDDYIEAKIRYNLSVNYTHVSECDITIKVESK